MIQVLLSENTTETTALLPMGPLTVLVAACITKGSGIDMMEGFAPGFRLNDVGGEDTPEGPVRSSAGEEDPGSHHGST